MWMCGERAGGRSLEMCQRCCLQDVLSFWQEGGNWQMPRQEQINYRTDTSSAPLKSLRESHAVRCLLSPRTILCYLDKPNGHLTPMPSWSVHLVLNFWPSFWRDGRILQAHFTTAHFWGNTIHLGIQFLCVLQIKMDQLGGVVSQNLNQALRALVDKVQLRLCSTCSHH